MRKIIVSLLATTALFGGLAQNAGAADMPAKARPLPPPPAFSWTGCYVGIHGGGIWAEDRVRVSVFDGSNTGAVNAINAGVIPTRFDYDYDSYVVGGQWGCNHQVQWIVFGWESDVSATDLNGSQTISTNIPGFIPITSTVSSKMEWFSTSRVRVGAAWDNVMLYITGGFAAARVEHSYSQFNTNAPAAFPAIFASDRKWEYGAIAGAGIEVGWGPVSVKAEALYYELSDGTHRAVNPNPLLSGTVFYPEFENRGYIARVGLNYRFLPPPPPPGPVLAKY